MLKAGFMRPVLRWSRSLPQWGCYTAILWKRSHEGNQRRDKWWFTHQKSSP